MTIRSSRLVILAGLAALFLAGCQADVAGNSKAYRPIPAKTLALMEKKGMTRRDPVLIRIYKEESELEVWKKDKSGRYAHLKTYEICRWSGTLGPKKVEGDGQAPEGFYTVTPAQLNPRSQYYLAFNLGYPNAFDRSHGRTGAHLMVHGDCLSKGCYAMTDEQIAEVYAIVREALHAGQPAFQVQAFPFRMTAENMARRRDDPNFAFWQNLKEGADHFELTKLEPRVAVCGRKYVFNAEPKNGRFDPVAPCPDYEVNPAIAMALVSKQREDDQKFNDLVASGLQTAAAYVPQNGRERRSLRDPIKPAEPVMTAAAEPRATGTIALAMAESDGSVPLPVPSPYASSQPEKPGGMFGWLRGDRPASSEPAATPRAGAGPATPTAVAAADRKKIDAEPVAASMGGTAEKTPFYKRWFGGAEKQDEKTKTKGAGAAAAPAVPAPAPRPDRVRTAMPEPAAASAPAATPQTTEEARPQPVEAPAPQPAEAAETGQPNLPPIETDPFGAVPMLPSGGFR